MLQSTASPETFPPNLSPSDSSSTTGSTVVGFAGEMTIPNRPLLVNGASPQSNSDPNIGWIVQKFGGTSVGKFAEKIAEDVVG